MVNSAAERAHAWVNTAIERFMGGDCVDAEVAAAEAGRYNAFGGFPEPPSLADFPSLCAAFRRGMLEAREDLEAEDRAEALWVLDPAELADEFDHVCEFEP
ncbi:MAG: hypothetical protein PHF72_14280 [Gammaproteobacteria bacterium]|nr:hypothetical protein [Gammaproteobacteria bacterium]